MRLRCQAGTADAAEFNPEDMVYVGDEEVIPSLAAARAAIAAGEDSGGEGDGNEQPQPQSRKVCIASS